MTNRGKDDGGHYPTGCQGHQKWHWAHGEGHKTCQEHWPHHESW